MPTNNPEVIKERQAAIKYFFSSKNSDVLSALQGSLKHIKFLPVCSYFISFHLQII